MKFNSIFIVNSLLAQFMFEALVILVGVFNYYNIQLTTVLLFQIPICYDDYYFLCIISSLFVIIFTTFYKDRKYYVPQT